MEKNFKIQRVSPERLRQIIERYAPRGLFLAKEGRTWVAVDNSTRDAWTEGFPRKRQAVRWLRGEFSVRMPAQRGEPYPVQSVIEFCQEMNEDLIQGDSSWERSDESYLSLLRQDEQALAALMIRIGKNSYQKQNI